MAQRPPPGDRWHVDKGIPLALIVTLTMSALTTSAGGIVYMSRIDSRLNTVEHTIERNSGVREDIVMLGERLRSVERLLTRVEGILDRRADARKSDLEHGDRR